MKGTSSSKGRDTGSITFFLCLQYKPNLYNWSTEGFSGSCRVTRELKHSDIGKSNRNMWLQTSGCLVTLWPFSDLMFIGLLGALHRNDLMAAHRCPGNDNAFHYSLSFKEILVIQVYAEEWVSNGKRKHPQTVTTKTNRNKAQTKPQQKSDPKVPQAEISR